MASGVYVRRKDTIATRANETRALDTLRTITLAAAFGVQVAETIAKFQLPASKVVCRLHHACCQASLVGVNRVQSCLMQPWWERCQCLSCFGVLSAALIRGTMWNLQKSDRRETGLMPMKLTGQQIPLGLSVTLERLANCGILKLFLQSHVIVIDF